MDPNNNQPINNQPNPGPMETLQAQQPVAQPVAQQPQPPIPPGAAMPVGPQVVSGMPKKGGNKIKILLLLLVLLVLGTVAYILFGSNQLGLMQKTPSQNSTALPSYTPAPSPTLPPPVDELNVESPEADLKVLDTDVNAL